MKKLRIVISSIFLFCFTIQVVSSNVFKNTQNDIEDKIKWQELRYNIPSKIDKTGLWFKNYLKTELSDTYDTIPIQKRGNMAVRYTEESDLDVLSGNIYTEIHYLLWVDTISLLETGSAQIYRYENSYKPPIRNQTKYTDLTEYLNDLIGYIGEKALAGSHVRLWITEDEFLDDKNRVVPELLVLRVWQQPYQLIPIFKEAMDDKGREILAKYLAHDYASFKESFLLDPSLKKQISEPNFVDYLDYKNHYPLKEELVDSEGSALTISRGEILIQALEKTGMVPYLSREGVTLKK